MESCGSISIHCNKDLNTSLYSFGISRPNQEEPYVWGGETVVSPTNEKTQKFWGLTTGRYRWFVKRIDDGLIIKSDYSEVTCDTSEQANEDIEDLQDFKMDKVKGAELANFIKNEVFGSIQRLHNKAKSYENKIISEITQEAILNGIAKIKTSEKIIFIFSYAGVLLKGKTILANFATDYGAITEPEKAQLDYIKIYQEGAERVYFNPDFWSNEEVQGFKVLSESLHPIASLNALLGSTGNGGIGNDSNTTSLVLTNLINSLTI